jgi:Spy/CpxP family protein refolding chaperone
MNMKRHFAALLATGVLSTLMAVAADPPAQKGGGFGGGGPGGGGMGGGGFGGRGGFPGRGGGMMALDDSQRQLFQEALQKERDTLRALDEKLRAAQKELLTSILAANYDETAVRAKADAVGKIQVEITLLRAKALATVVPSLKAEQKQQILESPMAAMLLNSGPGGGPRGFSGGGPGFGPGGGAGMGPGGPPGAGPDGFPGGGRQQPPKER